METYKFEIPQYLKDKRQWQSNNKQIYMRYKRHTSPAMETKLESMPEYEGIISSQDGLRLIKLLKKIYFEQDGSKQQLSEIVYVDKRLMLCWQRPSITIDEYTREFKARVQMCNELDSGICHTQSPLLGVHCKWNLVPPRRLTDESCLAPRLNVM